MPTLLTLAQAKAHMRVDNADEDSLINGMIDAAEIAIKEYLGVTALPDAAPVHAAALMLVGALFENREAVTDKPLTDVKIYDRLLAPYRVFA